MNNRYLTATYRIAEKKHARLWEEARVDAQALGHPSPLRAAYEATTATRLELQELEAEIELRTFALPLGVPTATRILLMPPDDLAASEVA